MNLAAAEATMARTRMRRAVTLALSGLLALPAIAQQSAQQTSPPQSGSGQSSSSSQNKQQKAPKNAAQENPFPADVSRHAAEQDQPNSPGAGPDATPPDAKTNQPAAQSGQKPGDAAQENPFPEDVSKSAAAAAAAAANGNGSGSSSSSSSSNPYGDADPNADLPRDTGRRKLKKPSEGDIESGSLAGEGKAQDDVRIGRFYLGNQDFKGAYGRFSEASRLDPTNLDAIYGLAASAAGLHHTDEALTNFKLYLQIAPDGNDAKSARKAIRTLSK
jgi:tetratricopeptide (TPR) repeat protein